MLTGGATRRRRLGSTMIATGLFVAAAGCGRQGPPLPPLRLTPQPLAELRVAQRGDRIEISYRVPAASVDGKRLPLLTVELFWTIDEGDLLRVAERRQRRAAPGERLIDVLEPLPLVGGTLRVSGRARATRRASALAPEVKLRIQAPPPSPLDLSVERAQEGVLLSWRAPSLQPCSASTTDVDAEVEECPSIVGYNVYRRAADEQDALRLHEKPVTTLDFRDSAAAPEKGWCYSVTSLTSSEPEVEGSPSPEACVAVSLEEGSAISSPGESGAFIELQASPAR